MTDFPDSSQLDLIEHSRAVALANDVIDALLARDAALSTERVNGLRIEESGHRACDALHWIAVARYRAERLNACRAQLMRLALLGPQRVPALLAEIDEPLLNRDGAPRRATSLIWGCSTVYQAGGFPYEVGPVHHRRDAQPV